MFGEELEAAGIVRRHGAAFDQAPGELDDIDLHDWGFPLVVRDASIIANCTAIGVTDRIRQYKLLTMEIPEQ
jgi:hypothetical protein